jgi:hypothetical protein
MRYRRVNEILEIICQKLGRAHNLSDQESSVYKVLRTGFLRLTISRRHLRWGVVRFRFRPPCRLVRAGS